MFMFSRVTHAPDKQTCMAEREDACAEFNNLFKWAAAGNDLKI